MEKAENEKKGKKKKNMVQQREGATARSHNAKHFSPEQPAERSSLLTLTVSYLTSFTSQLPLLFKEQQGASPLFWKCVWKGFVQERGKESTLRKKAEKQVGSTEQRSGNIISILTGWLYMTDVTKRRRHVGISSGLADRLGADCTH